MLDLSKSSVWSGAVNSDFGMACILHLCMLSLLLIASNACADEF